MQGDGAKKKNNARIVFPPSIAHRNAQSNNLSARTNRTLLAKIKKNASTYYYFCICPRACARNPRKRGRVAHSLPIPFPTPPPVPPAQRLSRQHKEAPTSPLRIFFWLLSLAIPKKTVSIVLSFFCFFFCAVFSHKSIYPLKKKKSSSKELCFFSCFYYYYYHHFITSLLLLLTPPQSAFFFFKFFLKIIIIDLFWSWSRWFDFCCTGSLRRRIVFLCVCVLLHR